MMKSKWEARSWVLRKEPQKPGRFPWRNTRTGKLKRMPWPKRGHKGSWGRRKAAAEGEKAMSFSCVLIGMTENKGCTTG